MTPMTRDSRVGRGEKRNGKSHRLPLTSSTSTKATKRQRQGRKRKRAQNKNAYVSSAEGDEDEPGTHQAYSLNNNRSRAVTETAASRNFKRRPRSNMANLVEITPHAIISHQTTHSIVRHHQHHRLRVAETHRATNDREGKNGKEKRKK